MSLLITQKNNPSATKGLKAIHSKISNNISGGQHPNFTNVMRSMDNLDLDSPKLSGGGDTSRRELEMMMKSNFGYGNP